MSLLLILSGINTQLFLSVKSGECGITLLPINTHIHKLSRPGRYLGGNLARTRKFLASERKFFGQQLTVAAAKSCSTTKGIKSKFFLKMKISINFVC